VIFRILPGERVAVVGHTGAGKTTLINLLMRFYDVQRGDILLDGMPIRRLELDDLRERIALVLQDVFVFSQVILDEATSSVDAEIEEQIERATLEVMRGRTSLVIAHRLSTVQSADRILVMHHGELCEEGTHAELLELGGLYAKLHELQFAAVA
jgi:ABC-type multidrug transport system fused ATPase/permease subunit